MPEKNPPMPPKDSNVGFLTGHALSLSQNRLNFLYQSMLEYGDFVQMWVGPRKTYVLTDPKYVEQVMKTKAKIYPKSTPGYKKVSEVIGNGVFTEVGENWKQLRKVTQPFFNPKNFKRYNKIVFNEALKSQKKFKEHHNKALNFSDIALDYTLRVIGQSLFNQDLGIYADKLNQSFANLIELTEKKLTRVVPLPSPKKIKENIQFKKALKSVDNMTLEIIENAKKQEFRPERNFIHAFIEQRNRGHFSNFKSEQSFNLFLLDQVKTMIFAGHETSATVLIWMGHFLCQNQEAQQQIRKELHQSQAQWKESEEISSEDYLEKILNLTHLKNFIQETMRMRPPAWSFGRVALEEDQIGPYQIQPGDLMTISPYLVHHHPKFWSKPFEFDPERFQDPKIKNLPQFTYFPFGGGPRVCSGSRLALLEMTALMALIIQDYEIDFLNKNSPLEMNPLVSLRADKNLMIKPLLLNQNEKV